MYWNGKNTEEVLPFVHVRAGQKKEENVIRE
jgi:hypothetical protein